ncbi:uncharacterized protein LOC121389886 [Gigantopelta aegis]|uniref:uncharacterized protein LOC121389886 n=1 Tax=Gigantopelta aegis TaxID=1735272 RepID=UPI001B889FAC|nr:uncharacterized protein LOC121389886 [Gigantopelta aegis]
MSCPAQSKRPLQGETCRVSLSGGQLSNLHRVYRNIVVPYQAMRKWHTLRRRLQAMCGGVGDHEKRLQQREWAKPKLESTKPELESTKPKLESTKPKLESTKPKPISAVAHLQTDTADVCSDMADESLDQSAEQSADQSASDWTDMDAINKKTLDSTNKATLDASRREAHSESGWTGVYQCSVKQPELH